MEGTVHYLDVLIILAHTVQLGQGYTHHSLISNKDTVLKKEFCIKNVFHSRNDLIYVTTLRLCKG